MTHFRLVRLPVEKLTLNSQITCCKVVRWKSCSWTKMGDSINEGRIGKRKARESQGRFSAEGASDRAQTRRNLTELHTKLDLLDVRYARMTVSWNSWYNHEKLIVL